MKIALGQIQRPAAAHDQDDEADGEEGPDGRLPMPSVAYRIHGALDSLRELDPAQMDDIDVALLHEVIKVVERWINGFARLPDVRAALPAAAGRYASRSATNGAAPM